MDDWKRQFISRVSRYWGERVIGEIHSEQYAEGKRKRQDLTNLSSFSKLVSDGYREEVANRLLGLLAKDSHYSMCPGCQWKMNLALCEICLLSRDAPHPDYARFLTAAQQAVQKEYGWRQDWAKPRIAVDYVLANDPAAVGSMCKEMGDMLLNGRVFPTDGLMGVKCSLPGIIAMGLLHMFQGGKDLDPFEDLLHTAKIMLSYYEKIVSLPDRNPYLTGFSFRNLRNIAPETLFHMAVEMLRMYKYSGFEDINDMIARRIYGEDPQIWNTEQKKDGELKDRRAIW